MTTLDHVVLAAPDLEKAVQAFATQTGVMPVEGGPHAGLGTRNALVSFGDGVYLEIIAPDPEQALQGTRGERFAQLSDMRLHHWALRANDLNGVAVEARAAGLSPGDVVYMSRDQPTGERLEWELMGLRGHEPGGSAPFFIDWKESPHPADSAPYIGRLTLFKVGLPSESALMQLLVSRAGGVTLVEGEGSLTLSFDSPKGPVSFFTKNPEGFGF